MIYRSHIPIAEIRKCRIEVAIQADLIRNLVEDAGLIKVYQDPQTLEAVFITEKKPRNPRLLDLRFITEEIET